MLPFGAVTIFLLGVVFGVQNLAVNYYLVLHFSQWAVILAVLDALLLLYILLSRNVAYAAVRGGVQWLFYSWLLVAKIVILYWFLFGARGDASRLTEDTVVGSVGIYVVFFLTPVIYSILAFRAARNLYGPVSTAPISVESMLHADMTFHVILDFIDIMVVFRYADLPETVTAAAPWLRSFIGTFVCAATFVHGYSFPTAPARENQPGDVFLTRKHAALVGIFLVDLPFLFIRVFLWVNFARNPGFSPFIVKNVLFLPLQAFRLNQCRLVERERAKSSQRKIFEGEEAFSPESAAQLLRAAAGGPPELGRKLSRGPEKDAAPAGGPGSVLGGATPSTGGGLAGERSLRLRRGASDRSAADDPGAGGAGGGDAASAATGGDGGGGTGTGAGAGGASAAAAGAGVGAGHFGSAMSGGPMLGLLPAPPPAPPSRGEAAPASLFGGGPLLSGKYPSERGLASLIRELTSFRDIPVVGFSFWKMLVKITHCLRVGGRHGLSAVLDEGFILGYWKQIRLTVPLVVACVTQVVLVILCRDRGNAEVWVPRLAPWDEIPDDYRLLIIAGGASVLLICFAWIFSAPFGDVVFATLFWAVRLATFYFTFAIFRDTHALDFREVWRVPKNTEPILLCGFLVIPLLRLVDAFFPLQSAVLGRKYLYFVIPTPNKSMREAFLSAAHVDAMHRNQVRDFAAANAPPPPAPPPAAGAAAAAAAAAGGRLTAPALGNSEFGWVTTSSVLTFMNCRLYLAPTSYNELLIGPDLIKDLRLMDMLVIRSWTDTFIAAAIAFIALGLHFDFVTMTFFATRLLLAVLHNVFAQTVRLLALRRYEVKILFQDIVALHSAGPRAGLEAAADAGPGPYAPDDADAHKRKFISLLDILEKYRRHGFFTSPGELFPNFL